MNRDSERMKRINRWGVAMAAVPLVVVLTVVLMQRLHPHWPLQTRIVEQQVAFVLRLRAFHRGGGGHVASAALPRCDLRPLSHAAPRTSRRCQVSGVGCQKVIRT